MPVPFIEQRVPVPLSLDVLSVDENRNLPALYEKLFSADCRLYIEQLYAVAMRELRGIPFKESDHIINGLDFIQIVVATAMYKYHCNVGQTLRSFALGFDRFDVPAERQRLYDQAQST